MQSLSYSLDAKYYIDENIFKKEKEDIFYSSWQYVCHKSQLKNPGDFISFKIADENLFVIKGKDDKIRGFYNICPHRGHSLVQNSGNSQIIVCPYHAWSFFTDGHLCKARNSENVPGFNKELFGLKEVYIDEFLGFIFANLSKSPKSLKSITGELESEIRQFVPQIDNLVFAHRIPYNINANWKLVVDNYLECYHCPPAHPDFVKLVDLKTYEVKVYDHYVSQIGKMAQKDNSAYKISSNDQPLFGAWWLWPNISFTVFCGPSNITIMNMQADGVNKTIENFDFFFLNTIPSKEENEAINYIYEKLQPEDVLLVENVQQNLNSRSYINGPLIIDENLTQNSEHGLKAFHDLIKKHIKH